MILSDTAILQEMNKGNIILEPFQKKHLNPCSVDLTLAPQFKVYTLDKVYCKINEIPDWTSRNPVIRNVFYDDKGWYYYEPLDVRKPNNVEEFTLPENGFVLTPGEVYLYAVNERIGVKNDIRGKVEGKSSLGRLGLFVHVTAGFIDPGFEGSLVLELVATRPIRIYPDMKICQMEYARVEGDIAEAYNEKAGSKYAGQTGVQESKMHLNYEQAAL